jgi:hypothetical protein
MNAQKPHGIRPGPAERPDESGMFTSIRTILRQEGFRAATTFGLQHG